MKQTAHAFELPFSVAKVLLSLSYALVSEPETLLIKDRNAALLERCRMTVVEFPPLVRWAFFLGGWFFDLAAILFGGGFKRFVNLPLLQQRQYLHRCLTSRLFIVRNLAAGLRGLVMICYFSHADVWAYIGYFPKQHTAECMAVRARLVS